ncbi:MAG TPA: dihydrofolate reductase family protein [Caulobacteraceae bacterium]|jgi:dihydrofolate reductase|nr:dihydrofolate reductase family protein [Caulobacteraceae bacterium]
MRKLIVISQVTLDGVMQGPGGVEEDPRNGFTRGGLAAPFASDEGRRVVNETIAGDFDLLLGRWTYDLWTGYWPKHVDNPIGAAFAKATKYVVTHRTDGLDWSPSRPIDGVEGVRALKATDGPELHLWGSQSVVQALLDAGLIDELRLWVSPVVLGQGKRLFEHGVAATAFKLVDASQTPTGVQINTFRPAGPFTPRDSTP